MMRSIAALVLACALAASAGAGQLSIDQGTQAGGLWCFPLTDNPKQYVYLPNNARLATDDQGHPQFSFIRYVTNQAAADAGTATITEARGGGVLHFLVLYETPPTMVEAAQNELRKRLNDKDILLRGPLVFSDGRYALVSSVINPAGGPPERKLLTTGRAPVLEGDRLALSFELTPEQSSLLMESFKMNTPDVSLVFDMSFQGLSDAYDADLFINWSEVRQSKSFSASGNVYFVSADVQTMFDDMMRTNAIKLRSSGSDAAMEGLLNNVYSKLLDLMFRQVEPERVPDGQRGGLADAIGTLINQKTGPLSSGKTTGFGLQAGFQWKDIKSSGTSTLNFNHRATVDRHSFITFNVGDFYKRYGNDANYFRAVNLSDPAFQQREIHVGVDGALLPEFDRFINSVTVTLRKQHADGSETVQEMVLDRDTVKKAGNDLRLVYGWSGDDDRMAWLKYDWRASWSFKGGGAYTSDWVHDDRAMIDLFAPYERRTVQLMGDTDALKAKGVRAVIVQVEYPFFAKPQRPQMVARMDRPLDEHQIEITLPLNQYDYGFSTTWQLEGNKRLSRSGRDSSGLIFVDELPEPPRPSPGN